MRKIDLNADLGEGYGHDREIMQYVSSANIACGQHAGSILIMQETVAMALEKRVSIGAHPGYPDRAGFGRIKMNMDYNDLFTLILKQVEALNAIVNSAGGNLTHVKAHGALYNSGAVDKEIARAIILATKMVNKDLIVFGPNGSEIEKEANRENMRFFSEVFADRAYMNNGTLVPRTEKGAIIESETDCVERTLKMINENHVISISGDRVNIIADTVCLHGDNEKAIEFARHLNESLQESGILISSKKSGIE